jgi:hypothetical protein
MVSLSLWWGKCVDRFGYTRDTDLVDEGSEHQIEVTLKALYLVAVVYGDMPVLKWANSQILAKALCSSGTIHVSPENLRVAAYISRILILVTVLKGA